MDTTSSITLLPPATLNTAVPADKKTPARYLKAGVAKDQLIAAVARAATDRDPYEVIIRFRQGKDYRVIRVVHNPENPGCKFVFHHGPEDKIKRAYADYDRVNFQVPRLLSTLMPDIETPEVIEFTEVNALRGEVVQPNRPTKPKQTIEIVATESGEVESEREVVVGEVVGE